MTPLEAELDDMNFAKPLLKVKDSRYQKKFLNLLKFSFDLHKDPDYREYTHYLWRIVKAYFENLKEEKSYKQLQALESFVSKYSSVEGVNWFKYELKKLKRIYMNYIGRPTNVGDCINKYNNLKSRQYLEISTPRDLFEKLIEIIETDLRRWIEKEGAYSFIVGEKIKKLKYQGYEELIQKTIKAEFEKALLRKGLRGADIIREPQLLDGRRADFLISYGLVGPIVVELKLATNTDLQGDLLKLKRKRSYKRLRQYKEGFKAKYAIFWVIDNRKEKERKKMPWEKLLYNIREAYERIEDVKVVGLECAQ